MNIVYLNGKYLKEEEACVPIADRGFLFGDGIFTTIKVSSGVIEHLDAHLSRLSQHCEQLNIESPNLTNSIFDNLLSHNKATKGSWRLKVIVTGGSDTSLSLPKRLPGVILITIKPYTPPEKIPVKLVVYPSAIVSPHSQLKTLAYIDRLRIKQYAQDNSADDALVCLPDGTLCETAFGNIFWTFNGALYTPHRSLPLIRGVELSNIIEHSDLRIVEGNFNQEDIPQEAYVYLCNSMIGRRPIQSIGEVTYKVDNSI
ncbi:MAG: aminotransferase class IV [Chlamydiota bacterium]|nr:aminotransferase class IV [Chlamydiota bacterium]